MVAESRSQAWVASAAGLHLHVTQNGQSHGEDQLVPKAAGKGRPARTGREDLIR